MTKSRNQSKIILFACILTTLFIIPTNIEPFSQPRLLVLSSFSLIALFSFIHKRNELYINKAFKVFYFLIAAFIFSLIASAIINDLSFAQLILGAWARNNGLAYYVSLFTLLIVTVNIKYTKLEYSILKALSFVGFIVNVWAYLQFAHFDFYNSLFPLYNTKLVVYSVFGNTNFFSAFFSFSFLANLGILLSHNFSKIMRTYCAISILFTIPILLIVDLQGLVLSFFGFIAIIYFWVNSQLIKNFKSKSFSRLVYLITFLFIGVSALILRVQNRLNKQELVTLEDRFYFWESATEMIRSNPWFGVGPDSFGHWVGIYRSKGFYDFRNQLNSDPGYTDNAHNVLLHIAATLGIPALVLYCFIVFFVLWRALIAYRVCKDKFIVCVLIIIFCAYLLQAIISIDHLGLSLWGWIIGGVLVNLSIGDNNLQVAKQFIQLRQSLIKFKIIVLIILAILPIYVAVDLIKVGKVSNMFSNSILDRTFLTNKSNIENLFNLAMNSNHASLRIDVAIHFANSGNLKQALILAEATSIKFPRDIKSLVLLSKIYKSLDRKKEYLGALNTLRKLEPLRY
jgi:O-antigen ligase